MVYVKRYDIAFDEDPWRLSAFVSALMSLCCSILMLLSAAIAFITAKLVHSLGLQTPYCIYMQCLAHHRSETTSDVYKNHLSPSKAYSKIKHQDEGENDEREEGNPLKLDHENGCYVDGGYALASVDDMRDGNHGMYDANHVTNVRSYHHTCHEKHWYDAQYGEDNGQYPSGKPDDLSCDDHDSRSCGDNRGSDPSSMYGNPDSIQAKSRVPMDKRSTVLGDSSSTWMINEEVQRDSELFTENAFKIEPTTPSASTLCNEAPMHREHLWNCDKASEVLLEENTGDACLSKELVDAQMDGWFHNLGLIEITPTSCQSLAQKCSPGFENYIHGDSAEQMFDHECPNNCDFQHFEGQEHSQGHGHDIANISSRNCVFLSNIMGDYVNVENATQVHEKDVYDGGCAKLVVRLKNIINEEICVKKAEKNDSGKNVEAEANESGESVKGMDKSLGMPLEKDEKVSISYGDQCGQFNCRGGQEDGPEAIMEALQVERKLLADLEEELENERNAAAIATSEAMAMISRLQEEKSAMQMEISQWQRMSEEKAEYDERAMELLKEILFKSEREKFALEKEVELYRRRLLVSDQVDKVKRQNESMDEQILNEESSHLGSMMFLGKNHISKLPTLSSQFDCELENTDTFGSSDEIDQVGCEVSPQPEAFREGFLLSTPLQSPGVTPWSMQRLPEISQADNIGLNGSWIDEYQSISDPVQLGGVDGLGVKDPVERSIFSTNAEETQFILKHLWVLEEELQELGQKDEGSYYAEPGEGTHSLPVHDVYEVKCGKEAARAMEKSRTLVLEEEEEEVTFGDCSHASKVCCKHKRSSKISTARRLFPALLEAEMSWEPANLFSCSPDMSKKKNGSEVVVEIAEEVRMLAMRLEVLEADRELLKDALVSLRQRDLEHKLLEEIAQRLKLLMIPGERQRASEMNGAVGVFSRACAPSKKVNKKYMDMVGK